MTVILFTIAWFVWCSYVRCSNNERKELPCPGRGRLNAVGHFELLREHAESCKDPFLTEKAVMRENLFSECAKKPDNPVNIYKAVART